MMKNSEYEKMPKSLQSFELDEKAFNELGKVKWVVTEKVHGANFSFVYEGNKLLFAKRKEYLQWTDDFFGFQAVAANIEEQVIQLFEQLRLDIKADRFILYGELFGGAYPHPDVAADPDVQAIQTGVYYGPSVDFCAFDIAVESDADQSRYFLDYETAVAYFERFGIFYAKVLFAGKLNKVLNFNLRINSSIPAQLALPELDSNLIEGVVIKPLNHLSLKGIDTRPIIKLKNPEFDEEKKFHEAEKWSYVPQIASRSEDLAFWIDEMNHYINPNRLDSVVSKTGRLDFDNAKRMTEIEAEFLRDIWADFNDNNNQILAEISTSEKEWITNRIKADIAAFIGGLQ